MLVVVYDSLTGLGKKFANSLGLPSQLVWKKLEGPCILVSRNSGAGQIPWTTKRFIKKYEQRLCHQWQSEALSADLLRGNG